MFFSKLFKKDNHNYDKEMIPKHVAIIMDGNGRWAKGRGLPRNIGHREGSNTLKKIVRFSDEIGIKYMTVYAFSTENWKRPQNEVNTLMTLLLEYLKNADKELAGKKVRIKVIGDTKGLPIEIQNEILRVEKSTQSNNGMVLNIALNYGSRDELTYAVRRIAEKVQGGSLKVDDIDESVISNHLYTSEIPEPELLIRTSGEKRLSNFLLWQLAYTEFWYTDVYWPDFSEKHLIQAISDYQKRHRRFGGI